MYENDFCEYAVEKKKEGSYLSKIIAAAVLFAIIAIATFSVLIPRFGIVGILVLILAAVGVWYLSRYLNIECEYSQSGAFLDFAYVYSKQYRRDKLSVDLKKCARKIAPYDEGFDGFNVSAVLDMRSSAKSNASYMLIYEDDGAQKAVLFDATKRLVKNLFHQIPSVVVQSNDLPEE